MVFTAFASMMVGPAVSYAEQLPISDLWAVSSFACDMINNRGSSTAEETVVIALNQTHIWLQEGECNVRSVEKVTENTFAVSASCEEEGEEYDRKYSATVRSDEVILDLGYNVFSLKARCQR